MWFLAIVNREDVNRGEIKPAYVLSSKFTSENQGYAPWVVVRVGRRRETTKRVIATSLVGNDMMIDFMSNYRTRVSSEKGDYRKFYPKGSLFWFRCDRRGNPDGKAVYIKDVPDRRGRAFDDKWKLMRRQLMYKPGLPEVLSKDKRFMPLIFSQIQPLLIQNSYWSSVYNEEIDRLVRERRNYAKRSKSKTGTQRRTGDDGTD